MIVTKNDGSKIIKVDIVVFRTNEIEAWIHDEDIPVIIPLTNISTIS